jgi:hypothetical protein
MEQNRKDYIVIRRPANNLGKPICPIYLVISREHLSKYVDKYLDGKIKRNPNLSAFEDLFNHIASRRRKYNFASAARRARYLNTKTNYY